jgi:hypothetical protein
MTYENNEEERRKRDIKTLMDIIFMSCQKLYENFKNGNDDNEGKKRGWPIHA